ncbi:neprilysin-4-like [Diabrotica virgifera virgifera]|uniref:Neprilysin-2-like n=1 Tax=Diabrotica virgifera virgifera TaxID=50390 RepID=A0ABM5JNG2_DIAVI|nr:neprilysin-4-like [Diabrotica virgifera virgifera]
MMKLPIVLLIVTIVSSLKGLNTDDNDDFPGYNYMNLSSDPCEDFFEYTCGNFKKLYPLSEGVLTIDQFTLLDEKLTETVRLILSENERDEDPVALRKAKAAYSACIDEDYLAKRKNPETIIVVNEQGFPLTQLPCQQQATNYSFLDIADAVSKYGIPMLFNVITTSNPGNASSNILFISKVDSLTAAQIRHNHGTSYENIIEEGFVTTDGSDRKSSQSLKPFDIFLRQMSLKLRNATESFLTDTEVFTNLDDVVQFTRAVFSVANVDYSNAAILPILGDDVYTVTLEDINTWTEKQFNDTVKLNWIEFFQHYFANAGIDITADTRLLNYSGLDKILYGILNLVKSTQDHVVKSYVMMRIFTHLALDGDAHSRKLMEDYFAGINVQIYPRKEYCARKIMDSTGTAGLAFAVAYGYQLNHFNVNNYQEVIQLIEDLTDSFRELIQNTTWMDTQSKEDAVAKLQRMIMILGHPDISYDKENLDKFYENLKICKWNHYGNSIRIKAFKNAYQISQISKRERDFWDKSPFEVNAYYNKANNKMIFPIAMLNPLFFGSGSSILDYGRIGSIIGHEMTHGFDNDGRTYAADGTMHPWWTNETKTEFANKANCFIDEYNKFYVPEIQQYVNGTATLNENIADNGGAREAYRALKKMMLRKNITKGINDFTPEQEFFIGFGTLWCNNPSISYLQQMSTNEHAHSKYRVNGVVSNMEEFAEAFNCPVGSKMNPSNKCRIW